MEKEIKFENVIKVHNFLTLIKETRFCIPFILLGFAALTYDLFNRDDHLFFVAGSVFIFLGTAFSYKIYGSTLKEEIYEKMVNSGDLEEFEQWLDRKQLNNEAEKFSGIKLGGVVTFWFGLLVSHVFSGIYTGDQFTKGFEYLFYIFLFILAFYSFRPLIIPSMHEKVLLSKKILLKIKPKR